MNKNSVGIIVCALLAVFAVTVYAKSLPDQIGTAEQRQAQAASPHAATATATATVADPNQSMEGTYCDRLAAVGKSMANGRNKGTRRTTLEAAITNTAEITETERAMYRRMAQTVYDDPSLTEAAMYARIHEVCEDATADAADADESGEN